jgi:hypothetical protein
VTEVAVETEAERVERWRLHVLVEAGFEAPDAEAIAKRADIDLHEAVNLLRRGCAPGTALEILL